MKTKFLYHAEAVAANGNITLPVQESIEIQASMALPSDGGYGTSRSENFRHRNVMSFHHAESHVVGSHSAKDKAHGTLSSVIIEGINVLNVVTCDRLVMRLTSKHDDPHDDKAGEPSFMIHGSHLDNLRIAGHKIEIPLATDLFGELSTWTKLTKAFKSNAAARKDLKNLALLKREDDQLPESKGMLGFTLARIPDQLPGGLTRNGHGIYVPHFGTVFIGEFFVSQSARRLLMLHVQLGCSVEGCMDFGSGMGNGTFWP